MGPRRGSRGESKKGTSVTEQSLNRGQELRLRGVRLWRSSQIVLFVVRHCSGNELTSPIYWTCMQCSRTDKKKKVVALDGTVFL